LAFLIVLQATTAATYFLKRLKFVSLIFIKYGALSAVTESA